MQRKADVPPRWDLFCTVIDNFGDIGVAWRLARQLAREHGIAVRLWVDDLGAFARIWPEIDPSLGTQRREAVEVRHWTKDFGPCEVGEVVIEAFGCALPGAFLEGMAARPARPVWINLEYLTAEAWAGSHHGLPSPHPRLPLTRYFYFPGYRADTGGLLREAGLLERAAAFRAGLAAYWSGLGLAADALHVSLFAYDNPALPALLDAWAEGREAVVCLVPEGRILPRVEAWLGETGLAAGATRLRGALTIRVLPFMRQDGYDRLLWACEVNFVRGEDSCVRAQWAGRPFVWQAYPQERGAHRDKLCALFELFGAGLDPSTRAALHELWLAWNGFAPADRAGAVWRSIATGAWRQRAEDWRDELAGQADLATQLLGFIAAHAGS